MSWDELEALCRRERLCCGRLGLKRANANEYEVEFLCNYKRKKKAKARRRLQRWEDHLNHKRNHPGRILVLNEVDLEGPPKNFTYINNYQVGRGIVLDEMAVGCECKDCLKEPAGGCCPGASLHRMAYNERGQVRVRPGQPIYECNSRCSCSPACPNRVVQKGIQFDLCIFRTENGRGWGVRTLQRIKKNTFIMEYVGEIITTDEAERRGHVYDRQGATYLFDLDYVEDVYTVDAAHQGNVAIRAGEELTFDYKMQMDPVDSESTRMDSSFNVAGLPSSPRKRVRVECRCGSDSCRKYLF
ncbi:Histone-lysine N-methyltransferase SUV39H1 [Liparis tanakae]|uniref:Histone-lysine N-methyltransferase n=1 Tax=Liparis tanakae TaxID=230148 RepID=A0A4Z2F1I6_9TELE|nr:Histone-lysine N-methyltransferase SUV39H1 [Liparis tanakae]